MAASICTFLMTIKNAAIGRAKRSTPATRFGSMPIVRRETLDGVKFYLEKPKRQGTERRRNVDPVPR